MWDRDQAMIPSTCQARLKPTQIANGPNNRNRSLASPQKEKAAPERTAFAVSTLRIAARR